MSVPTPLFQGLLIAVFGTPAHAESPALNRPPEIQARPSAVIERSVIGQPAIISPLPNAPAAPKPAHNADTDEASAPPTAPAPRVRPRKPPIAKPDPLHAAINLANTQFNAQQYAEVIDTLHAYDAALFQKRDIDSARMLGWAAYHTTHWTLARRWFTRAANWSNQADDIANIVRVELAEQQFERAETLLTRIPKTENWQTLRLQTLHADALHAFELQDYARSAQQLRAAHTLAPLDASQWEILGWSEYHLAQYPKASLAFEQSYRQQPSTGAAQGLVYSLYAQNQLPKLYALSDEFNAQYGDANSPLAILTSNEKARQRVLDTPPERAHARVMLDAQARLVPSVYQPEALPSHARLEVFAQDNNIPFNQGRFSLTGLSADFLLAFERDRLELRASTFNADDGQQRANALREFYARWRHYNDDGLETTLGLGSTPQGGFIAPTFTGELGLGWLEAERGGRVKLYRQSVQQSVLSMSGFTETNNDGTLTTWGRVTRQGINAQGYQQLGAWKLEGSLSLAALHGQGVADNRMVELYANALHPLPINNTPNWKLGPVLYASAYQHNRSAFTPGNGGYYSPEHLVRLAALLRYQQKWDGLGEGWNIDINTSLGWQTSFEAEASTHPLSDGALNDIPASRNRGIAATFDLDLFYAVNPHWRYGLLFSIQESPSYSYARGHLYLSYLW